MTAVIFDLDGTLVDSAPDIHAAVNRTLIGFGAEALPLAQVTSFIGNGVPALIARVIVARSLPQPAKAIETAFLYHYHRDAATLTTLYPLLAAAARLGHAQAIFVGDSEVDAETADRAKIPFVLFTEGYRNRPPGDLPHVASFSDYLGLPDLIESLQKPV